MGWLKAIKSKLKIKKKKKNGNDSLQLKEDSERYKAYITNVYKEQGYTVWEYNQEKNSEVRELHLILKKRKDILFVHCRYISQDITLGDIASFESEVEDFIEEFDIFKSYNIKLRYTMAGLFLEESAYKYIKNHSNDIDYEIIKIEI